MTIRVLITGGTIDKEYNPSNGELEFSETNIPRILEQANVTKDVKIEKLMLIDSLDMTIEDRKEILKACQECNEESIVITHGTDTMEETAQLLGKNIQDDKTIVLTGAMKPYTVEESDALFNLGSAITNSQTLDYGVYVAMNGEMFTWDNVTKNKEENIFESKK